MSAHLVEEGVADLVVRLVASEEARENPYPLYAALRDRGPILDTGLGFWCATTYEACQEVLRHSRLGKDPDATVRRWGLGPAESCYRPSVLRSVMFANPPDHARLRRPIVRHLTPGLLAKLQPRLERTVDKLLEGLGSGGEVEAMSSLAFPYPMTVIGELFGVPDEERQRFRDQVRQMTVVLEPTLSAEDLAVVRAADESIGAYFSDLFARDRNGEENEPCRSAHGSLVAALSEQVPGCLSAQEAIDTAIFLYGAGFETTSHLIGNALAFLADRPAVVTELRQTPERTAAAVSEILRYDTSVQIAGRALSEEVRINGQCLPGGTSLLAILGSANRDPSVFSDPDSFRLDRREKPPLSFGGGIHHCVGAGLAALESKIFLQRLIHRFDIEPLQGRRRRSGIALRGFDQLPLVLHPAGGTR